MLHDNGFSPDSIIDLRGKAIRRASMLRIAADELGGELELLDTLLAVHCAGPSNDARLALVATGRRLTSLMESEVS